MSTLYECRYCGHMSPHPWITCLRCDGRWVEWGLCWLPGHLERLRKVEGEREVAQTGLREAMCELAKIDALFSDYCDGEIFDKVKDLIAECDKLQAELDVSGYVERTNELLSQREQARDTACRMMEEAEQLRAELASANEVLRRLRRQEER